VRGTWLAWERRENSIRFWRESPKRRNHSEDRGVDRRMRSEWFLRKFAGGIEWIQLAQDRDQWRALVNTVMNLRVLVPRI
jgi:hypothetical protein